jgi:3-oxoacyl-[acyl-carrier protein] reductase
MLLKGKVALITGASQGIGKATAIAMAKEGANIVVNYIGSEENAKKTIEELKKLGVEAIAIKADVSNLKEVEVMFKKVREKFKTINVLVNNAGIVRDRTLKNMTPQEWHEVIDTNLNSIYNVTKNALPLMEDNGRIISISSVAGTCGNFGQCNYSAAKAGIIGFTKSLAKELGKRKITVNAIAPGFIETDMTKKIPFFRKKMIQAFIPLKEFGKKEDVANAIVFLSSDKARYITGEVLNVGGGLNF